MTEKPIPLDPTDTSHPQYDPAKDPTHPFYEGNMTEDGRKPDPGEVWRGSSPRHHQVAACH